MHAVEGSLGHSPNEREEGLRWTRAVGIIPATPYEVMVRCGIACGKARLGAPGWAGEKSGLFEHPAAVAIAQLQSNKLFNFCPQRVSLFYRPGIESGEQMNQWTGEGSHDGIATLC